MNALDVIGVASDAAANIRYTKMEKPTELPTIVPDVNPPYKELFHRTMLELVDLWHESND